MKILKTFFVLVVSMTSQSALAQTPYQKPRKWTSEVQRYTDQFLTTDSAAAVAERVMSWQQASGGWPKNIRYQESTRAAQIGNTELKFHDESTMDNGATMSEIEFLARMYNATHRAEYRLAVERGIDYMLRAQYDNGGWPQYYPRNDAYHGAITFNDDAMVNVMNTIAKIRDARAPFGFAKTKLRRRCKQAFDKGVECIINLQYVQNGVPTVWCAQHDAKTLQPCKARAYELASLSGAESMAIVMLLMSVEKPSERLIKCVDNAMAWFDRVKIENTGREMFVDSLGRRDYRMVSRQGAPYLWARFYTLDTNCPFFCDRDGVMRYNLSDIGYERRNGYSWYSPFGTHVQEAYRKWREDLKMKKLVSKF